MRNRLISRVVASLLVLTQLLLGPFAHAASFAAGDVDCAGEPTAQVSTHEHATGDVDPSGIADEPGGTGHHCRTHVACACPCAHTPALGATWVVLPGSVAMAAVAGPLAGPAFDAPLFDFLRPPN